MSDQREPLLAASSTVGDDVVKSFVPENWYVDAFEAASCGLKKATLGSALMSLFVKPRIPGGTSDFEMARDVGGGIYRSVLSPDKLVDEAPGSTHSSMRDVFLEVCQKHADKPCMGSRSILSMRTDDKGFEKYVLGGYEWLTYREVEHLAVNFGRGLTSLGGFGKGARITFFADTKKEWQIAAQGCFQYGLIVSTSYANLGRDALAYSINQCESEVIFTDAALVETVASVLEHCETIKYIVYTDDARPADHDSHLSREKLQEIVDTSGRPVTLFSFDDIVKLGTENTSIERPDVTSEDLAVIMYTSGSTGNPKGVEISGKNMVSALAGVTSQVCDMGPGDVYVAYLPLAHILELIAESGILATGAAIGYGSTKTITDGSVCIDEGKCRGDAPELRPTLMAAVPAIMDKIRNGVTKKVNDAGGLKAMLFKTALESKRAALEQGLDTPFWNKLVFDSLRARLLGGRLRYMLSGGGPLGKETQHWMNVVFCCPVGQGYGATETTGSGTIVWPNDRSVGRAGVPIVCSQIKLRDWEEGGYFVDPLKNEDSSITNPRGEILLGGGNVAMGYYKSPEKTAEAFIEEDGVRYFCTSDIGEICPDGGLRIIDRKKDLVKLQGGEYVSYGKLEPMIRDSELVDNVMVFADPNESYCIAITTKVPGTNPTDEEVLEDVTRILKKNSCAKFEIPKKIKVVDEEWNPQNDLATAALKLKRVNLRKYYKDVLTSMYGQ